MKVALGYSGGMDSTALLLTLLKEGHEVCAYNFQYGSKHNEREHRAATTICQNLNVTFRTIDLDFVGKLFRSDLLKSGGAIPEGHYEAESMKATVVPFRNGIILSILAGLAESEDAQAVFIANHAGDHEIYPDCRLEFIAAMNKAIYYGTGEKVTVVAPFTKASKAQVCATGCEIDAQTMGLTWSCYNPVVAVNDVDCKIHIHCGKCGTCVERIEAFILAGQKDNTAYADKEFALNILREKHGKEFGEVK